MNKAVQFLSVFRGGTQDPQAGETAAHSHAPHLTTGLGHIPATLWDAGDKGENVGKVLTILKNQTYKTETCRNNRVSSRKKLTWDR